MKTYKKHALLLAVPVAAVFLSIFMSAGIANANTLSLSQNNITLSQGQVATLSVSGGSNVYLILSNSNANAVNLILSGSQITATGVGEGSATITICDQNSLSTCVSLNATTQSGGNTTTTTNNQLSFSQSNPSLSVGQTLTITVSGGNGSYFISSNPNPNIAGAVLNGNSLALSGVAAGSDTITICATAGGCGTLSATVGGSSQNSASSTQVTLSQTTAILTVGQSLTIAISGGTGTYFLSSAPTTIVQTTINGNTLILSGQNSGTAALSVCSSVGGCVLLSVLVNASASVTPATPIVTPTPVIGNTVSIAPLLAILNQIHQLTTSLIQLELQAIAQLQQLGVSAGTNIGSSASVAANASYKFYAPLSLGSTGADVIALQQRLTAEGFYSGPVNGTYSVLVQSAVSAYQISRGLSPVGIVGPATRSALNGN